MLLSHQDDGMGRRGYPAEFRQRVLDLVAAGRRVRDVAVDLGISDQTVYGWRRQERMDQGIEPGLTSAERAELAAARRRIRELENRARHPSQGGRAPERDHKPKRRFAAVEVIAAHGLPVQLACRVLSVSESGYDARRSRAPSARAIRHVWLTEVIRQVHSASRGTYGIRRVHADLILG
jgi:putative transposase